MHAQHAYVQPMLAWQCREAKHCPAGGNVALLQEGEQFVLCISKLHTLSDECQRALGLVNQVSSSLQLVHVDFRIGRVACHLIDAHGLTLAEFFLCIGGEVEHNRTGPTRSGNEESTAHSPSHILRRANLIAPFRDGLGNTHQVNFLKGIGAQL